MKNFKEFCNDDDSDKGRYPYLSNVMDEITTRPSLIKKIAKTGYTDFLADVITSLCHGFGDEIETKKFYVVLDVWHSTASVVEQLWNKKEPQTRGSHSL